jgi:hypothetical protein
MAFERYSGWLEGSQQVEEALAPDLGTECALSVAKSELTESLID